MVRRAHPRAAGEIRSCFILNQGNDGVYGTRYQSIIVSIAIV